MVKRLYFVIINFLFVLYAFSQQDSLVSLQLQEVSVIGKQSVEEEMSAVTAISGKTAERLNVSSMRGMSEISPNFYIPQYGSRMTSSVYVRGLGTRIDQPVVGLNVDGVPILNKNNYDFDISDIDKIEIFRGAQTVLNGRNTMCGQVNIQTLSPWKFQGLRLRAEYGRANSVKASVGYYVRMSEHIATSLTGDIFSTDGFYRNEYNNSLTDKEKSGALRWKALWRASEHFTLSNATSGNISRQDGYPYEYLKNNKIAYNDTCFYSRISFSDGLTLGWSYNDLSLNSVSSVQYLDDNMTLDQDFTPQDYFTLTQKSKEWSLIQDVYAKGKYGDLNWLGGVFGFYKSTDMHAPVTFKDDGISNLIEAKPNQMNPTYPIEWNERKFVLGSEFLNMTKGFAIYQQSRYNYHNWDFEFGLRFDIEWATLIYDSYCDTGYKVWHVLPDGTKTLYRETPLNMKEHGHLSRNFNQILPKLAVGYSFNDAANIYANISKGYKAGGFNSQMFSDVLQQKIMAIMGLTMNYDVDEIVGYKPEKSWNYEVGFSGAFVDGKMNVNGTLFYISCTDQQLTVFPDGLTTGRIMTNAGRTRSFGAETSVNYRMLTNLQFGISYGYTNATFRKYDNGRENLRGKKVPYAPSNTLFVNATYNFLHSIIGSKASIDINARGIGSIYWNEENTVKQPLYVTLGANLLLDWGKFDLKIWGENITSTKYDTFYFVSIGNAFVQRGRPWNAGITLRYTLSMK